MVGEVFRTPDDRFADLPDFPFEPSYYEFDGLRLAYIDEGDGPVVFLLHGMPSWSFLWRKVLPPLIGAGYRVIVPDLIGFGRSDKPTRVEDYSYDRFVDSIKHLIESLDLREINFVVHDWGGPIGTRALTDLPDRVASAVLMDTGFNTGDFKMSENWQTFHDFVVRTEDLPIGFLVKGAVAREMPDEVFDGYEAPFPNPQSKAGARAFPPMIPRTPDHPDAVAGRRALEAFTAATWPKLVMWADKDPVLPQRLGGILAERIGAPPPVPVENAGHFLQEDAGELIGETIAEWLNQQR
jgi:haloalkane dehalogenase